MENNEQYWNERVRKFAHTGWSDFSTYYYDQPLRLKTMDQLIRKHMDHSEAALDYGCGVGDFAQLLGKHFDRVTAVDLSDEIINQARKVNGSPKIRFGTVQPSIFHDKYDLILSITVLQHVLEDERYGALVRSFHDSLRDKGKMIILESFNDEEEEPSRPHGRPTGYMKLRSVEKVQRIFRESGFKVVEMYNFYHPTQRPTALYQAYITHPMVRALRLLLRFGIPLSKPLLKRYAERISARDEGIIDANSMTKILVFEK